MIGNCEERKPSSQGRSMLLGHWLARVEGLGFGPIAWLLTDNGLQCAIQRNERSSSNV